MSDKLVIPSNFEYLFGHRKKQTANSLQISLATSGRERGCGGCGASSLKPDNSGKLITTPVVATSSVEEKFSHEYSLHWR